MLFWYFFHNIDGKKAKKHTNIHSDKIETFHSDVIGKFLWQLGRVPSTDIIWVTLPNNVLIILVHFFWCMHTQGHINAHLKGRVRVFLGGALVRHQGTDGDFVHLLLLLLVMCTSPHLPPKSGLARKSAPAHT